MTAAPTAAAPLPCLCGHQQASHRPDKWSGLEYCAEGQCECYAYRATAKAEELDQFRALVAALPRCGVSLGNNGAEALTRFSDGLPLVDCGRPATRVTSGLDCAQLFCDEHATEQMASADLPYAAQLRAPEGR